MIVGGCTAMLAGGCQVYGGQQPAPPAPVPAPATGGSGAPGDNQALTNLAEIPVGGGKFFDEQKVVVTQPTAGVARVFSTVCTHQGCNVNRIGDGILECPCHGSKFRIDDGSVAGGPAPSPLPQRAFTEKDGSITLT